MKKFLHFMFIAALACTGFTSCNDDDNSTHVVGISAVTVTPDGSEVSYICVVDWNTRKIENKNDSVAFKVTDDALAQTTVKATGLIGSTVYYEGRVIGENGVVVDATKDVILEVRSADGSVTYTYTLTVVRAQKAGNETFVIRSSQFRGFPNGVIDYDMANFNGSIYACVTSVDGDTENYQMFKSDNGAAWEEVEYTVTNRENCVIGGEGARLCVFNNRLYVIGGARTKGADKYGNAAEISDGWMGPSPTIDEFRVFSTADGHSFRDDTENMTYKMSEEQTVTTEPDPENPYMTINNLLSSTLVNPVVLNDKMYIRNGYWFMMGMAQPRQGVISTEDGVNYVRMVPDDSSPVGINSLIRESFINFKDKLYTIGGFKMFPSPNNFLSVVCATSDCETWEEVAALPEELTNIYSASVATNGKAVYLIGGELFNAETQEKTFNTKIFRTTDMVNWEVVAEVPEAFGGRRTPRVVTQGDICFIFGGYTTTTSNTYGYTSDTDVLATDTWVLKMD